MRDLFKRLMRDDSGQNLIEYALLAGLVALAAVAAITTVGTDIVGVYNNLSATLSSLP
jgi:pilus assembly protein Flp/PilA